VLAALALLVALLALFVAIFRDPFGPVYQMNWNPFGHGLGKYDFSTPAQAYKSRLQMVSNGDFRAELEYSRLVHGPDLKERLDTLEVKDIAEVKLPLRPSGLRRPVAIKDPGKTKEAKKEEKTHTVYLLFVTYKQHGDPVYKVEGFEKHEPSGLWKSTYVSAFDVEEVNKDLAKKMSAWEAKGK
jgi:hypothetical protein